MIICNETEQHFWKKCHIKISKHFTKIVSTPRMKDHQLKKSLERGLHFQLFPMRHTHVSFLVCANSKLMFWCSAFFKSNLPWFKKAPNRRHSKMCRDFWKNFKHAFLDVPKLYLGWKKFKKFFFKFFIFHRGDPYDFS